MVLPVWSQSVMYVEALGLAIIKIQQRGCEDLHDS